MLLLAVDTSGQNGGLALARVMLGQSDVEILESVPLRGGTFSAQLVPQVSALLAKHGYSKSDLSAFAVVSGPGSFTGLRVGLAAIKALAEVLQKPIAAVSLLEAVARCASLSGRVLAALDAGRGEVYLGDYEVGCQNQRTIDRRERLLSRAELIAEAGKLVVTPDLSVAEFLRSAGVPCEQVKYPSPGLIASLGWERVRRGETVRPDELEANYIRRSDAEIFSQPKR